MNSEVREFEYKPRWTHLVLGGLFFGGAAAVLWNQAATNDRGVIINHLIELGPKGATTFYWGLTACSLAFVVVSVFLSLHRLTFQQRLAFGPTAMTVPASRWSRREIQIAYDQVRELAVTAISGQRFLFITHGGGKYAISAGMLPSAAVFEEVRALLAERVRVAAEQREAEQPQGIRPKVKRGKVR